jgi:hypothetical protein
MDRHSCGYGLFHQAARVQGAYYLRYWACRSIGRLAVVQGLVSSVWRQKIVRRWSQGHSETPALSIFEYVLYHPGGRLFGPKVFEEGKMGSRGGC